MGLVAAALMRRQKWRPTPVVGLDLQVFLVLLKPLALLPSVQVQVQVQIPNPKPTLTQNLKPVLLYSTLALGHYYQDS
jgi:hypothetical protein